MPERRPNFQRRHFQSFAERVSEMPKSKRKAQAEKLAAKFAADNPRFDKKRFMKACGV